MSTRFITTRFPADHIHDNTGQLVSAVGKESGGTTRLHEKFGYVYDAAGNLQYRTNNALVQSFANDARNQITSINRSGTLTVSGAASAASNSLTVNGQSATVYADQTFAKDGFSIASGTNTFTAIGQNSAGHYATNSVAVELSSSVGFTYDANGNCDSDSGESPAYST